MCDDCAALREELKQANERAERLATGITGAGGRLKYVVATLKNAIAERDAARKGLFHRITGWDKDGQTEFQILDELQESRNEVASLREALTLVQHERDASDSERRRLAGQLAMALENEKT